MKKILWLALLVGTAGAQVSNPSIVSIATLPTACLTGYAPTWLLISTGLFYTCQGGVPTLVGGGGSGTVTTSGTPTTNTLALFTGSTVVGNSLASDSGTTLTYTGTGGMNLSGSGALLKVGASAPSVTAGTAGGAMAVGGTAPTLISGDGGWYPNSTNNCFDVFYGTTDGGCAALLASPTFTGTPAAPTATAGTSTTQLATTAFVTTALPVSAAITAAVAGSGISAISCSTATCTNLRGTYTMTATTVTAGVILILVWPTTTTAYACSVAQNGGAVFLGTSHSVATATGMTISVAVSVASGSITVDYICKQ